LLLDQCNHGLPEDAMTAVPEDKNLTTMTTVTSSATAAMLTSTSNSNPPARPGRVSEVHMAIRSDQQDAHDVAERFREDIHRRYEAPFQAAWRHGGLNE
jgi:hypothetical protein